LDLRKQLAGSYDVERELARGAMARVYVARTPDGHEVALKVLPPELASASNAERFLREIRITSDLAHPNILPLLDSGVTGRYCWYVMPLLHGDSLRARLKDGGPLAPADMLVLAGQVGPALTYAHRQGVVHRDMKPENVMQSEGRWVVLDFGLARAVESNTGLTGTGMPLGTPAYMSPEQITGAESVDARADIYGFGCVLYEALTGRPPFVARSIVEVLRAHMDATPAAPSSVKPGLPMAFDAPILRALAKDPAARPQTADELVAELAVGVVAPDSAADAPDPERRGLLERLLGRRDKR
jgi:serine/threonine-protein kinase